MEVLVDRLREQEDPPEQRQGRLGFASPCGRHSFKDLNVTLQGAIVRDHGEPVAATAVYSESSLKCLGLNHIRIGMGLKRLESSCLD